MIDQVWIAMQYDSDGDVRLTALGKTLDGIKAEVEDYIGMNLKSAEGNIFIRWEEISKFDSEEYYIGYSIDRHGDDVETSEFHVFRFPVVD